MTREVLEKKLKIAGVPDYIYNLTGQGKKWWMFMLGKNSG